MSKTILVIDDENSIQASLQGVLGDEGYSTTVASSGKLGLKALEKSLPDAVLLDIWMPEMDGLETLQEIKKRWPQQLVIMMSGHGTIETAVKATKLGAYDFIEKPLSLERLLLILQNGIRSTNLARENQALRKQVQKNKTMIGKSQGLEAIRTLVQRVAPTTGSVLITGEHGTGKELVAQNLHALSNRFNKPFIEINCAAIPEELIESELFGHEKGAFTGATQKRRGKFDLAHDGTLFLDEIGDMSLKTQAKVLRILQEQKFERVGGSETITTDVRIIAATNKDLRKEILAGHFREDLYYRLKVVLFHVPPLRERKEDIPLLAEFFLKNLSHAHGKKSRLFSQEALKTLETYSWPGNVRELRNLIERLIILTPLVSDGMPVTPAEVLEHLHEDLDLPSQEPVGEDGPDSAGKNLRDARTEFEKDFILRTLKDHGGNISKTATVLGIERSHLHKKIKSFGIEP